MNAIGTGSDAITAVRAVTSGAAGDRWIARCVAEHVNTGVIGFAKCRELFGGTRRQGDDAHRVEVKALDDWATVVAKGWITRSRNSWITRSRNKGLCSVACDPNEANLLGRIGWAVRMEYGCVEVEAVTSKRIRSVRNGRIFPVGIGQVERRLRIVGITDRLWKELLADGARQPRRQQWRSQRLT